MGTCANAREGACKIHDEYAGFQWSQAREVLGWPEGQFNIGWYCSDRICDLGRGEHLALIWESADGQTVKRFTFDELRKLSNAYARFFTEELGLQPGDRCAVFMQGGDRDAAYVQRLPGGCPCCAGRAVRIKGDPYPAEALLQSS